MGTLTFEVRCRPKQSSLVTILLTLVPLTCEAVLNQTDCETYGSWLKDAFTITSICPSFFFGPPLYNISFFRRSKLFTFLSHLLVFLFRETVP